MKLSEIKPLLTEGIIPSHITMILQEVLRCGKITNTVQAMIMAQLIDFFQFGNAMSIRNFDEARPTNKDLLDSVKAMEAAQQVELASWLLSQLSLAYAGRDCLTWCDPQKSLNDWVSWVLRRQD